MKPSQTSAVMRAGSPQELGALFHEERQRQSLTQAQLAERAGVTREWLGRFERGANRAELVKVFHLARALGLVIGVQAAAAEELGRRDDFDALFDSLGGSENA